MLDVFGATRRRLGRIPLVRRIRDAAALLRKHAALRAECVPLAHSRHAIFVDPREPRGLVVRRGQGSGQWALQRVWRDAVEQVRPTIVVDVGANYGEFIFFTDYEPGTVVLGIEADPKLMQYLERSRGLHPQGDRIELSCALASSAPSETVPFYVDATWSGLSSALPHARHANSHVELVRTTSVDELLRGRVEASDRLLFKIDVEGYEPRVLQGMERTLAAVGRTVGIVEFNTAYLEELEIDPETYLDGLRRRFALRVLERNAPAIDLMGRALREVMGPRVVMADLVVASDEDTLSALGL